MSRRATLLLGWALAVLAMLLFSAMGRWQLSRMGQKQAMLDQAQSVLDRRVAQPLASAGAADRYLWAAGEGRFAASPAVLLDNQQRDGRPGVRAYRVFQPEAAAPLLVELGWLPLPGDRTLPEVPAPTGAQAVQGLLVPPPARGLGEVAVSPQADGSLLVTALEIDRLRAALGEPRLAPRVLKLDPALPLGYDRDLDILPNTLPPAKHLGYAVQWFGLALTVLITALVLTFRKPRQ